MDMVFKREVRAGEVESLHENDYWCHGMDQTMEATNRDKKWVIIWSFPHKVWKIHILAKRKRIGGVDFYKKMKTKKKPLTALNF